MLFNKNVYSIYGIPDINDSNYPALIHDHNWCIFDNGHLLQFSQLERITQNKYASDLPYHIDALIKSFKPNNEQHTHILSVDHEIGKSFISHSGKIRIEGSLSLNLQDKPQSANCYWKGTYPSANIINHELAHIFSTIPFYGNFNENSMLIHYDGGASLSNFSCWLYKNKSLKLVEYHYDLKQLTSLYNANALTFAMVKANINDQNGVPGKFMGLASYGKYDERIEKWLVNNNYFASIWKHKSAFFESAHKEFGIKLTSIDNTNSFIQNIAATIQHVFIRQSIAKIAMLQDKLNTDYLYLSGGVALNIKINTKLINSGLFKDVFIPPCTNDSGLSLGAAACYHWFNNQEIQKLSPYLNNYGIESLDSYRYTVEDIKEVADHVANHKMIAICNGYGEAGPRALGNRSIVARADSRQLAQKISMECKEREWYRPIAPIMLAKNVDYFTGVSSIPLISKYMLMEFDVLAKRKSEIEGCTHTDNTSRIQTINERKENAFMYDLLMYLDEIHQIKCLINTSFNKKGFPMVHNYDDAIRSVKAMNLNGLVYQGKYHHYH